MNTQTWHLFLHSMSLQLLKDIIIFDVNRPSQKWQKNRWSLQERIDTFSSFLQYQIFLHWDPACQASEQLIHWSWGWMFFCFLQSIQRRQGLLKTHFFIMLVDQTSNPVSYVSFSLCSFYCSLMSIKENSLFFSRDCPVAYCHLKVIMI